MQVTRISTFLIFTLVEMACLFAWLAIGIEGAGNLYRAGLGLSALVTLTVFSDKALNERALEPEAPKAAFAIYAFSHLVPAALLFWCGHFGWGIAAVWCWAAHSYEHEQLAKRRAAAAKATGSVA